MNTSTVDSQVGAKSVEFDGDLLRLYLTNGRAVMLPFEQIPWNRFSSALLSL